MVHSFKYPVPHGKEIEEHEKGYYGLLLLVSGITFREVLPTVFSES